MYNKVENWVNCILKQNIPPSAVGLNFNLYEDGGNKWSMELVATESFDIEDDDWCCEEVFDFGSRKNPFVWVEEKEWNEILSEMVKILKKYLVQGQYSHVLKKYQGVGIGFVDGDIEILFVQ